MVFTRILILGTLLLTTHSLFAEEKAPCPCVNTSTWSVDAALSLVVGGRHSIVRAVRNYGIPISLGVSQKKDEKAFFPLGQDVRFSYFRTSKGDNIADYYFLAWGLNYNRLWNVSIYFGYELLLTLFKTEIANNEVAITYHDFYIAPYLGVRKVFFEQSFFNLYGFAALHVPTHELKETFLELGVGGAIPL